MYLKETSFASNSVFSRNVGTENLEFKNFQFPACNAITVEYVFVLIALSTVEGTRPGVANSRLASRMRLFAQFHAAFLTCCVFSISSLVL